MSKSYRLTINIRTPEQRRFHFSHLSRWYPTHQKEFSSAMKLMRYSSLLLALALAVVCAPAAGALQGPPGPPPPVPGYGPPPPPPRPGWDAPPGSFRSDIERRAFHEGILGAQRDRQNGRRPNVNNRDEYMRKTAFPVPPNMLSAYRRAFRAGYDRGVQIYYGPRR